MLYLDLKLEDIEYRASCDCCWKYSYGSSLVDIVHKPSADGFFVSIYQSNKTKPNRWKVLESMEAVKSWIELILNGEDEG